MFEEYQKETQMMNRLERNIKHPFSTIATVVTLALAKSLGVQKMFVTTYENQIWVKKHRDNKINYPGLDPFEIPNIYDPAAEALGMVKENGWWRLDAELGNLVFSPSLRGVAQSAFDGFNGLLNGAK
jgi:hypothetical protein